MTSVAEHALRRYGRASYDVTPRLAMVGDELYFRSRVSLDRSEVMDVNDRLSRGTYSHYLKSYPRCGPASPRISVVIAGTCPPFNENSPREMDEITARLLRPTVGSRLRQSAPVIRKPPPPLALPPPSSPPRAPSASPLRAGSLRFNYVRAPPPPSSSSSTSPTSGILRLKPKPAEPEVSEGQTLGKGHTVRFAVKTPRVEVGKRPAKVTPFGNTTHRPTKSAPAHAQRAQVTSKTPPRGQVRTKKENSANKGNSDAGKSKRKSHSAPKSTTEADRKVRLHSGSSDQPRRLNFIATILETDDEYSVGNT